MLSSPAAKARAGMGFEVIGRALRLCSLSRCALGVMLLAIFAMPAVFAEEFLDPEEAFQLSAASTSPTEVDLHFKIAPEYYMYEERFQFELSGDEVQLGDVVFPPAVVVYDPTFGEDMPVYYQQVTIQVGLEPLLEGRPSEPAQLQVTSQGCADAGLCYSPIIETIELSPVDGGYEVSGAWAVDEVPAPLDEPIDPRAGTMSTPQGGAADGQEGASTDAGSANAQPSQGGIFSAASLSDTGLAQYFSEAGLLEMMAAAFVLGLLLSFTPCVLPMVPILLSIIAGQKDTDQADSKRRGLSMAAVYVFGVSVVYTLLGIVAGLVGASLAMWLQKPWVLISFAVLLALLALSMFDVYTLQAPAGMQARLQGRLNRLPAGRFGGVFVMGMLSALIVGPCVAAPLAGVLLFISQTGDVLVGGLTLFALAWGSGVLLLVVGATSNRWMPKAGEWMNLIKYGFGVLLLATAWWMLSLTALVPGWLWVLGWALLALWAALLLGLTRALGAESGPWAYFGRALGGLLALWAVLLVLSVGVGNDSVLRPLAGLSAPAGETAHAQEVQFERIETVADLEAALAGTNQPVLLDFYADWCVSCIEMERFTFTDPVVAQQMQQMLLLQVDVTDHTEADRELLKRFNLFGPPGIIFFDEQGQELSDPRVIGFMAADQFSQVLERVFNAQ